MSEEEVRAPYERALSRSASGVAWVESLPSLLALRETPAAVIVDLDALPRCSPEDLTDIRGRFPKSDLIALSSKDSSRLALLCVRSGFADFLSKPVSPEEIAFAANEAGRRRAAVEGLRDPRAKLMRGISQIVAGATPAMVRLTVSRTLQELFRAEGAAWISGRERQARILASVPADEPAREILFRLPSGKTSFETRRIGVFSSGDKDVRKVLLPCQDDRDSVVFLWGIHGAIPRPRLDDGAMVLRQGELALHSLMNVEEARRTSFIDELTGLYNSRYLRFSLASAVQTAKRKRAGFSVLFIDVDRFKAVNDSHGHLVGGDLLVAMGRTVRNAVRKNDSVFRYGGDEFVVLLPGADLDAAREVGERIRTRVEKRQFLLSDVRLGMTVSIGVAAYPATASGVEELMEMADRATYSAKRPSRNAIDGPLPREIGL